MQYWENFEVIDGGLQYESLLEQKAITLSSDERIVINKAIKLYCEVFLPQILLTTDKSELNEINDLFPIICAKISDEQLNDIKLNPEEKNAICISLVEYVFYLATTNNKIEYELAKGMLEKFSLIYD